MDKITGKIEFNQRCYNCGYSYPNNVSHSCPTVVSQTVPPEHVPTYYGLQFALAIANERLEIAKAALREYANPDAWWCGCAEHLRPDTWCSPGRDVFRLDDPINSNGHEIAQTALSKIEEEATVIFGRRTATGQKRPEVQL